MIKVQHTLGDDRSPSGVHYLPNLRCPNPKCQQPLTGAGSTEYGNPVKPSAGDLTICVYCETISKYATGPQGWRLLKLSTKELKRMDPENKEEFDKLRPILAQVWGPIGSRSPPPQH